MTRSNPFEQLTLDQLRTRTSRKWRTHPPDVLPLWVAEMDVLLAEPIANAVTDAVRGGDTGYTAGTELAEAVAAFAAARWGWHSLEVAATSLVPDVMRGVVELLGLITDPGDAVVVTSPVYPPFYAFPRAAGRRVIEAPLGPQGRLDLTTLQSALGAATAGGRRAALLLSNPHNPTGAVHTAAELSAVAALADRYSVRVISDEIHAPLVLAGASFVPYLSVAGSESGFSLISASKGWNLAGLKAALAVAGPAAAADLARLPEGVALGASHLGVIAHTAAFRYGGDWLDDLLFALDGNRHLLEDLLHQHLPEVHYRAPEATFLAWLDCTGLRDRLGGRSPAEHFLLRARVAVNDGRAFGTGGENCVRLNFATSPAVVEAAVERVVASLRSTDR